MTKHLFSRRYWGRLWPPLLLWILLSSQASICAAKQIPQPYLALESESYGGPVSVWGALQGWRGDYRDDDREWTRNWFEVGAKFDHWSLGLLYRYEMSLRFSMNAAQLYYRLANHLPLSQSTPYQVSVSADGFAAEGIRAAFRLNPLYSLNTMVGLSVFNASHLQYGTLSGIATAVSPKDYNYNARVDYRYSKDKLFGFSATAPNGYGFAVDLSVGGYYNDWFDWRCRVRDLLGLIHWRNVPHTVATASSQQKQYDSQGYVHVDPLVSGQRSVDRSFNQILHPKLETDVTFLRQYNWRPQLSMQRLYGMTLYGVGFTTKISNTGFAFNFWPQSRTIKLRLSRKSWHFGLGLTPGSAGWHQTQTLWLSLGINR